MMKELIRKQKREKLFWFMFLLITFVLIEISHYLSTGNFYICGRFGNCGDIDFWGLLAIVILFIVVGTYFNLLGKKNFFNNMEGISAKAASWYQTMANLSFIFFMTAILIFLLRIIERR